jgi:hypothetical protein
MNIKKAFLVVPLSLAILAPTTGSIVVNAAGEEVKPSVTTPAVELRSTLDNLLSEHVYLAIETMRKGAQGAADFEASAGALSANTEDLSAAIGSVYGEAAGKQFKKMWSDHIGFFVDYVNASAANDEQGKEKALKELDKYRDHFSKFLEKATDERLEAGALAEGLQTHVKQLVGAFDSYVAGNYEKAYEYEREAISHMYMVSKGLSSAIANQFPDKFDDTKAVTPAGDLRSALNQLLSEHAGLAMMAMQNGIDGSEDFAASAQALSANTDDLTAAIASIYGEEASKAFKEMWSNHIGFFVDYVKATGANDEEAQKEALSNLENYRADFSSFIETATDGRVPAGVLAEGLQMHVNQLVGAFNSYVDEDYETAYDSIREAYAHMFGSSKALSGAFVDQFPDKFAAQMPTDMPKTGLGGMSQEQLQWEWIAMLMAVSAALIAIRKYAVNK